MSYITSGQDKLLHRLQLRKSRSGKGWKGNNFGLGHSLGQTLPLPQPAWFQLFPWLKLLAIVLVFSTLFFDLFWETVPSLCCLICLSLRSSSPLLGASGLLSSVFTLILRVWGLLSRDKQAYVYTVWHLVPGISLHSSNFVPASLAAFLPQDLCTCCSLCLGHCLLALHAWFFLIWYVSAWVPPTQYFINYLISPESHSVTLFCLKAYG